MIDATNIETLEHRGIKFLIGFAEMKYGKRWWMGEPAPSIENIVDEINTVLGGNELMWRDSMSWPTPDSEGSKESVITSMKRDIDTILDGGLLKPLAEKMRTLLDLSEKFWGVVRI